MSDIGKKYRPGRKIDKINIIFKIMSVIMTCILFVALMITVLDLPEIGRISNPDNNEVEKRYVEEGIKETGHNKIFIGHPIAISDGFKALLEGEGGVDACVDILRPMSNQEVKEWIRTMVPNYTPTSNR